MTVLISSIAKNDILLYARKYKAEEIALGKKFLEEIKLKTETIKENPKISEIIYENVRVLELNNFPINLHYTFDEENNSVFITAVFHNNNS